MRKPRERIDLRINTGEAIFSALTDPKEDRTFIRISFAPYNDMWWTERWGLKLIADGYES